MTVSASATVHVVGDTTIRREGKVVDPRVIGGPRCSEVLAYLTVHRHSDVSLDRLADIVWPGSRPKSWNAALRSVISKVRDTLEAASISGDSITSRRGHVVFVLPTSVTVDLETLREQCRPSAASARVRADAAREAHRTLASPVLRGISGEWADEIRTECDALRMLALDIDAAASIELGAHDRAISCAEALIALDPLQERAYRHAIRGYVGLGDRAHALDAAARCRRALSEELGVDPSAETQELFLAALRDDAVPAGPRHPTSLGRSAVSAHSLPRNRTAPVGRESELAQLDRALNDAAQGRARCVVVSGDAGAGKTTLVLEALERAERRGVDVLFGRCSEDAIVAFEPFAEAAGRELDALGPGAAREWLEDNGSELLRLIPGAVHRFRDLLPAEVGGSTVELGDDRAAIVTAVHRWLTSPSRSTPTVIVIDDLQWASSATHALLRYLLQASSASPVCFVVTARTVSLDDPEVNATLASASRQVPVCRIALVELDVEHVRQLVDVHRSTLDPLSLHLRTHGHPLFVTSILEEDPTGIGGAPPASILEFVRRAELALGASAHSLLQVCAVIGAPVPRRVLRLAAQELGSAQFTSPQFANPQLTEAHFSEALDELIRVRMVDLAGYEPHRGSQFYRASSSDDTISLRHPLVQEVVYSGISPGRRESVHSIVGYALAASQSDVDSSAHVAFHLSRGLPEDRRHARTYAYRAGDHAFALGAYEDALVHYAHAVDSTSDPEVTEQQCRALIGLGRARRAVRDPGARATALSALSIARQLGDRVLQIEAVLASERHGMMFVQRYAADTERVDIIDAICRDMVRTGHDHTAEYAILLSQIGIEHAWDGRHDERVDAMTRAAEIARALGDGPLLARVSVAALIGLRVPQGHAVTSGALRDLDNLIDMRAEILRDVTTTVWLMRARLEAGDLVGAETTLDTITDAHIDGDPELEWLANYGRLGLDLAAGRLVRCEEHLTRIRAIPPSPTDSGYYGRLLPALTALGTLRGDLREIADQSDSMRARFDANPVLRAALAVALVDVGEKDSASELLSWYDSERLDAIPMDPMWLSTVTLIGRAAAQVTAAPLCEQIYARLSAHAECTVLTWASVYGVVHHHLAHLALGFGDLARARYHVVDAQEAHTARGFAGWAVESDYLSLCIDTAGASERGAPRVAEIRSRAAGIGATSVVRRLDAL